jgi:uncharacterized protein (TIGR04222 family)
VRDVLVIAAYVVVVGVAGLAAARYRRRVLGMDSALSWRDDLDDGPTHDERAAHGGAERIAYLWEGGGVVAVAVALTVLRESNAVDVQADGTLIAVAAAPPQSSQLVRAVHHAVEAGAQPADVAKVPAVADALRVLHGQLLAAGWLLSTSQRRDIRAAGFALVGVAGCGMGLTAITQGGWPSNILFAIGGTVAISAVHSFLLPPRRTTAGQSVLDSAWGSTARDTPSPELPMLVAVYGPMVMHTADPVFAIAAQIPWFRTDAGPSFTSAPSNG